MKIPLITIPRKQNVRERTRGNGFDAPYRLTFRPCIQNTQIHLFTHAELD